MTATPLTFKYNQGIFPIDYRSFGTVILPLSYQAFYPFKSDFIDQVSNDYVAIFDNQPSFGGDGVNTVANTNLHVTTFKADKKGVYLDDGTGGVNCILADRNDAPFVAGVDEAGKRLSFIGIGGVDGKYVALLTALFDGVVVYAGNTIVELTSFIGSSNTYPYAVLKGSDAEAAAALRFPNKLIFDFSNSGFFNDIPTLTTLRSNAGDTELASLPTPEQWDVSGDFRFGYIGVGKTVADVLSQVLLQTGNMGITTGIGITFAEIGAAISSLSVDSDTIVGECFLKYIGGMLSIVIDGVESTPVASVAPTIGAFAQIGANISNLSPAPGTYGGLLFEVL